MDRKTTLIHYVHYYAVCDCINLSSCSEAQPTAPIDVQKLIVDEDDLTLVTDDTIMLIARYSFVVCKFVIHTPSLLVVEYYLRTWIVLNHSQKMCLCI